MHPHLRLGKKAPRVDRRTLPLARYLTSALPPPPASCLDFRAVPADAWPMDGNATYGDCTMAGAAHLIQEWTEVAQRVPVILPDDEVTQDYLMLTGGKDTGLDLLTVLNWWRQTGFGGATGQIHAFAQIQLAPSSMIETAIYLFGGAYLGLALPDFAVTPPADGSLLDIPWTLPSSGMAPPANPANGHCVAAVGYDTQNLYVVTWGGIKAMSWGFYQAYADEAFAIASEDWMTSGGATPTGLNLAQLEEDLADVTSPSGLRQCGPLLAEAKQLVEAGHVALGLEQLVAYVECTLASSPANNADRPRIRTALDKLRRKI
jgi:hypothetical protein